MPVKNMKDLMELMNKGQRNRTVASTNMNRESSRSHAIFTATIRTITVDQDNLKMVRSSRLNVIDLAGSERVMTLRLPATSSKRLVKSICRIHFWVE